MSNPVEILLVEDNPGDVRLTQEALREARIANRLHTVRDGEMALDYLFRRGRFEDAVLPDLIFLDLNIPRVSGLEVLDRIKSQDVLKRIPIVILTSSEAEKDIVKSYDLHANCYVKKPLDLDGFVDVIKSIEGFWLSVVKLATA